MKWVRLGKLLLYLEPVHLYTRDVQGGLGHHSHGGSSYRSTLQYSRFSSLMSAHCS